MNKYILFVHTSFYENKKTCRKNKRNDISDAAFPIIFPLRHRRLVHRNFVYHRDIAPKAQFPIKRKHFLMDVSHLRMRRFSAPAVSHHPQSMPPFKRLVICLADFCRRISFRKTACAKRGTAVGLQPLPPSHRPPYPAGLFSALVSCRTVLRKIHLA